VGIDEQGLLAEQMAYYRARATGYDRAYAERQDLPELLAIVDELQADVFGWRPTQRYDTVFFAVLREVDDGRCHRIVKVFRDAGQLSRDLAALRWSAQVRSVAERFPVGVAEPIA
jgi:hypothetical protein